MTAPSIWHAKRATLRKLGAWLSGHAGDRMSRSLADLFEVAAMAYDDRFKDHLADAADAHRDRMKDRKCEGETG